MAGRNKTFPCGHTGKGQFCHRCKQADAQRQAASAARQAADMVRSEQRQQWQERLENAPVALKHLPRNAQEKCLQVVDKLQHGTSYMELQGKRLSPMNQREIISIPLGWSFRLICREAAGQLEFVEAISHETYNNRLASGGWL